jgi:hypothetical protein
MQGFNLNKSKCQRPNSGQDGELGEGFRANMYIGICLGGGGGGGVYIHCWFSLDINKSVFLFDFITLLNAAYIYVVLDSRNTYQHFLLCSKLFIHKRFFFYIGP